MRQRRRETLGINSESAGIDPDLIGVARQSGVFSEEGGERVVVGAKIKKVPGKNRNLRDNIPILTEHAKADKN